MTAPTQYYCDPVTASNAGDGTSTPWSRASENAVQYAINNIAADATNGVQINVKSGTPHAGGVLGAALNLTSCAHTPSAVAPLIIRGYNSVANDGGIGEIDGNETYGCFTGIEDYIMVVDMEIYDAGSELLLNLDNYCTVYRCILHGVTGPQYTARGCHCDIYSMVHECHVYDVGGYGIDVASGSSCCNNYLSNGPSNIFTTAIWSAHDSNISGNILSIDGTSFGIRTDGHHIDITNNSIFSAGGSGYGINLAGSVIVGIIANNIIEGFSDTNGAGIDFNNLDGMRTIYRNNAFYNNDTNELDKPVGRWIDDSGNTDLSASAFAKTGADTFDNRYTYFTPVNTDSDIFNNAHPTARGLDKGAVQHAAAAATTTTYFII